MKIKLDTEYKTFYKGVKCIMECTIYNCKHIMRVPYINGHRMNIIPLFSNGRIYFRFKVAAVSRCSPEDLFDLELGKRIAESRASIKAFRVINSFIKASRKDLDTMDKGLKEYQLKATLLLDKENKHLKKLINNE